MKRVVAVRGHVRPWPSRLRRSLAGPSPGAPGSATGCSRGSATAATTSSTTTSTSLRDARSPTQAIDGTVNDPRERDAGAVALQPRLRGRVASAGSSVNGAPAAFRRDGRGARDHAAQGARATGALFIVTVSHFVAVPTVPGDDPSSTALFIHARGHGDRAAARPRALLPAVQRPPARQGELRHPLRRAGGHDRGRQRRPAREVDRPRAHALRLRPAPADGDRADPARGRRLRRHQPRASTTACSCATSPPPQLTAQFLPLLAPSRPARLDAGRASATTRSTSTARSWSMRTSASRWRPRRSELIDTFWFDGLRPGHLGRDAPARAVAHVVRRQRRARTRGATCGSTRATRAGTSSSGPRRTACSRRTPRAIRTTPATRRRRADEGRLRARRRVARRVRPGRAAVERGRAVRVPALPRRRARALRAAPEGRQRRVRADRDGLRRRASATARRRPTTSSRSPRRSPAARRRRRSCATGSTAPRRRRCRATRTGREPATQQHGPPPRRAPAIAMVVALVILARLARPRRRQGARGSGR